MILKVKKTYGVSPYIVFCPSDFKFHTHCWNKEVAYIIKRNVENLRVPKTKDIRLLVSHIRVSDNEEYINAIENKIRRIKERKKNKNEQSLCNKKI